MIVWLDFARVIGEARRLPADGGSHPEAAPSHHDLSRAGSSSEEQGVSVLPPPPGLPLLPSGLPPPPGLKQGKVVGQLRRQVDAIWPADGSQDDCVKHELAWWMVGTVEPEVRASCPAHRMHAPLCARGAKRQALMGGGGGKEGRAHTC